MSGTSAVDAYQPTERTVPSRHRERAHYDRELVHAILDEGYLCHLAFVRDGAPVVLPTLYCRVGDRLYLHGSTGARPARRAGGRTSGEDDGLPVSLAVTRVDGLVLARSAFHHSMNYRSVVVHGVARRVTDPSELATALDAVVDQVVAGRSADCRPADAKELAATAVLRLDLVEVSAKVRAGGPADAAADDGLPYWSGVLPLQYGFGTPIPADDLTPGVQPPDYLPRR